MQERPQWILRAFLKSILRRLMVEVCRSEATNYFPAVEVYLIAGCQCGLTLIYKQNGRILSSLYSPGSCAGWLQEPGGLWLVTYVIP